ncbi:hypothetical protein J6590_071110 [Homalodisca vitripennis]|nr:hypothetical protein J6590_071110 [Homalodisca vitripennis]
MRRIARIVVHVSRSLHFTYRTRSLQGPHAAVYTGPGIAQCSRARGALGFTNYTKHWCGQHQILSASSNGKGQCWGNAAGLMDQQIRSRNSPGHPCTWSLRVYKLHRTSVRTAPCLGCIVDSRVTQECGAIPRLRALVI